MTYTVADGDFTFVGGSFSLLTWALLVVGFVVVSRAWRALPRRRHEARGAAGATS